MTVSLRNTPLLVAQAGTSLTISIASSYNGTTPAVNNLLVAVFAIQANATTTLGATPAGWALTSINEVNASNTQTRVAVYTRNASGTAADNAPTWAATATSTLADVGGQVTLYIFADSSGLSPALSTYGVAQGTSGANVAPVTASRAIAGCYAIASNSVYASTAATFTWTTPTAPATWSVVSSGTSAASTHYQYTNYYLSAPTAGSALTCTLAHSAGTSTFQAAFVAVIAPPQEYGAIRSASAAGHPSDAFANSVTAGTLARPPGRGRSNGNVKAKFQNAPASYSSQQPAGVRVIAQRTGSAQASPIPVPVVVPPPVIPATFYPLNKPSAAVTRPAPCRGTCLTNISISSGLAGPPLTPLQRPVQARQLPARGGRAQGRAGKFTAVVTPALFYSFRRPAAAVVRLLSARGRAQGRAGASEGTGSRFTPAPRPVQARQLPRRAGSAQGRRGVAAQVAPQQASFYPLNRPVSARYPSQPRRGRMATMAALFPGHAGPPLTPLQRPVQARRLPQRGGSAQGHAGTVTSVAPVPATFYPLRHPVATAVRVLSVRGRTASRAGTLTPVTPAQAAFYPLRHPAAARVPSMPRRGRMATMAALYPGYSGPPVTPLRGPVQARRVPQRGGSTQSRAGTFTPVAPVLAPFYPFRRPVAAVARPLPARGRAEGQPGSYDHLGPPVTPLQRAVRARLPQQPLLKGRAASNPGVRDQTGSAVTPLRGPVATVSRGLPPRGRAQGRTGIYAAVVQPGPPVYPLHSPVAAVVRPQPARGRAQGHAGVFRGSGPAIKPPQHPVYAWRPGPRRGICLTSIRPAPPVPYVRATFYPLRKPVQSRLPFPPPGRGRTTPAYVPPSIPAASFVMYCYSPRTAWETGPPQLASVWQAGGVRTAWETGDLFTAWEAGAFRTAWQDGSPSQT